VASSSRERVSVRTYANSTSIQKHPTNYLLESRRIIRNEESPGSPRHENAEESPDFAEQGGG
jgi:hypothetical protein